MQDIKGVTIFEPLGNKPNVKEPQIDSELIEFKKYGFWFQLYKPKEETNLNLVNWYDSILEPYNSEISNYYKSLIDRLTQRISIYTRAIEECKIRLAEEEQKLIKHQETLNALKVEVEQLISKIAILYLRIQNKRNEKSEQISKNLINEFNELNNLHENVIDNEIKSINKIHQNGASTKAISKKFYEDLLDVYKIRFNKVQHKIENLVESGINDRSSVYLLSFGSICAGVAAWFFSIFTYKSDLGSQDIFYYLFQGFLSVGSSSSLPFQNKVLGLFLFILGIGAIIVLFAFLIKQFNKFEPIKSRKSTLKSRIKFGITRETYLDFRSTTSWYLGLLQILPYIFICGIVIIVLSSVDSIEDKTDLLNNSSGGLVAGAAIVAGLTGIVFLYVTLILERNYSIEIPNGESINTIKSKKRWEIKFIILLFIVSGALLIGMSFVENMYSSDQLKMVISILLFITTSLIASLSFSYGMRYRGLIVSGEFLEKRMQKINLIIKYYSGAQYDDGDKMLNDISLFNEKKLALLNDRIESIRNILQKRSLSEIKYDQNKKLRILNVFKLKRNTKPLEIELNEELTKLMVVVREAGIEFPDLFEEIAETYSHTTMALARIKEIDGFIIESNSRTGIWKTLDDRIINYEGMIDNENKRIFDAIIEWKAKNEAIEVKRIRDINALSDGYHLGEMYSIQLK